MSGILAIQCRHCAGGATRIDKGFTEKKNPEKFHIFWFVETCFGQNHWITVQNNRIFIDFYEKPNFDRL